MSGPNAKNLENWSSKIDKNSGTCDDEGSWGDEDGDALSLMFSETDDEIATLGDSQSGFGDAYFDSSSHGTKESNLFAHQLRNSDYLDAALQAHGKNNKGGSHPYNDEEDDERPSDNFAKNDPTRSLSQVFEGWGSQMHIPVYTGDTPTTSVYGDDDLTTSDGLTVLLNDIDHDLDDINTLVGSSTLGTSTIMGDDSTWRGQEVQGTGEKYYEDAPLPIPTSVDSQHRQGTISSQTKTAALKEQQEKRAKQPNPQSASRSYRKSTPSTTTTSLKSPNRGDENKSKGDSQSQELAPTIERGWRTKVNEDSLAKKANEKDEKPNKKKKVNKPAPKKAVEFMAKLQKETDERKKPRGFCAEWWSVVVDSPLWVKVVLFVSFLIMLGSFIFLAILLTSKPRDVQRTDSPPASEADMIANASLRGTASPKDPY